MLDGINDGDDVPSRVAIAGAHPFQKDRFKFTIMHQDWVLDLLQETKKIIPDKPFVLSVIRLEAVLF